MFKDCLPKSIDLATNTIELDLTIRGGKLHLNIKDMKSRIALQKYIGNLCTVHMTRPSANEYKFSADLKLKLEGCFVTDIGAIELEGYLDNMLTPITISVDYLSEAILENIR